MKAHLSNHNQSQRKTRLVADLIRGKDISRAEALLDGAGKKAAGAIKKLLLSAVANAKENNKISKDGLYIKKIIVGEGNSLKRTRPAWRGIARRIIKGRSHIDIVLGKKEEKIKK